MPDIPLHFDREINEPPLQLNIQRIRNDNSESEEHDASNKKKHK